MLAGEIPFAGELRLELLENVRPWITRRRPIEGPVNLLADNSQRAGQVVLVGPAQRVADPPQGGLQVLDALLGHPALPP